MAQVDFDITGENSVKAMLDGLPVELKKAIRNSMNDSARLVMARQEKEIKKVFHNPTRLIQKPFFVERADINKTPIQAKVRLKDVYGSTSVNVVFNTLSPHIPGYPATRDPVKGMESALRRMGKISDKEFLVPSRTAKLDKNGNIPGSQASKMLNDIGAFAGVAGFDSTTKAPKVKYMWGEVKDASGKVTRGIWLVNRFVSQKPAALVMVVVKTQPRYAKRFRFHELSEKTFDKVLPGEVDKSLDILARKLKASKA